MPKAPVLETGTVSPSLLAFKPRQVLLLSKRPKMMQNDEKDLDQKAHLLRSIAGYLESSGFSKTLKKFRLEAKLEKGDLGGSAFDLEEVFCKFLAICVNVGKKHASQKVEVLEDEKFKEKKKSKKNCDSLDQQQAIVEDLEKPAKKIAHESPEKKCKDQKKKKKKLDSKSLIDNIGHHSSESLDGVSTVPEHKSVADSETEKKSKDKKKKKNKNKVSPDSVLGNAEENVSAGKQEDATDKQKKEGSKKRKRLVAEEDVTDPADKNVVEEFKRRKTEGSEEPEGNDQSEEPVKQIDAQENGNIEKNGENSSMQKTKKKQRNGSVEPQTVNRFQRVKVEEVVFSNERLKDNSYWAKDGADSGYGAKAEEILGQVKGRGFRHEKTKKKRGTYRGGQIDLHSHSVKFNYSDED